MTVVPLHDAKLMSEHDWRMVMSMGELVGFANPST